MPLAGVVLGEAFEGVQAASRTGALSEPSWSTALVYRSVMRRASASASVACGDPFLVSAGLFGDLHLVSVGEGADDLVAVFLLESDFGAALPAGGEQQCGGAAGADHDGARGADSVQLHAVGVGVAAGVGE